MGVAPRWTDQTVVATARQQVSCDLGAEAAILQLDSGTYYTLNPVGARVWALLQRPIQVADLRTTLLNEYDVPPDQLQRDLHALLDDLHAEGLVDVRDGDAR